MSRTTLFLTFLIISLGCKKEIQQFTLTTQVNPMNSGSITPANGTYELGQKISLNAIPAAEYLFKSWEGGLSGNNNPTELLFNENKTIVANFEKRSYPLSLTIEGEGKVKEEIISIATNSSYPSGTRVKLTASPSNAFWSFAEWKGDFVGTDSSFVLEVKTPKNITAVFKKNLVVPAVNQLIAPDLNWNNHAYGKNSTFDINNDGIPDIISSKMDLTRSSKLPPRVTILDYTGKTILDFDILKYKPAIRDSLNNVYVDFADINGDGFVDLGLNYMGEWNGPKSKYIGNNAFLLMSKNSFNYDVIEILENPNDKVQFNMNLFDWDSDGLTDLLFGWYNDGIYYKNVGKNTFEKSTLIPKFFQLMSYKLDFDKDGAIDFVNFYINQKDENGYSINGDGKSQVLSVLSKKGVKNYDVVGKTLPKTFSLKAGAQSYERITLVDGDGDGDKDLIIGSLTVGTPRSTYDNGWVYHQEYFENTGNQFEFRDKFIETDDKLWGELQVWTKDLDGDGDEDLFYPTYVRNNLGMDYFWWENTGKGFKINKNYKLIYGF
jgi:hypothetical protein